MTHRTVGSVIPLLRCGTSAQKGPEPGRGRRLFTNFNCNAQGTCKNLNQTSYKLLVYLTYIYLDSILYIVLSVQGQVDSLRRTCYEHEQRVQRAGMEHGPHGHGRLIYDGSVVSLLQKPLLSQPFVTERAASGGPSTRGPRRRQPQR